MFHVCLRRMTSIYLWRTMLNTCSLDQGVNYVVLIFYIHRNFVCSVFWLLGLSLTEKIALRLSSDGEFMTFHLCVYTSWEYFIRYTCLPNFKLYHKGNHDYYFETLCSFNNAFFILLSNIKLILTYCPVIFW